MSERRVPLARIVDRLPASTEVSGDASRSVTSLEIDSRRVRPGALFVAVRGEHVDGHAFVAQAVERGASAVVVEAAHEARSALPVPVIHVADSRRALSTIAAVFYDDPSRALDIVGITGTNGKTTTTRMVAAIANAAGRPCGVIGTVGAEFGDKQLPLSNTTPLPPELHGLLAAMRDAGARTVAMEVSSHALALDRVEDVRFAVGVLTNVTRDHLDFHETMEAYAAAKRRLFMMARAAVINIDDPHGARWATELRGTPEVTYGESLGAMLRPTEIVSSPTGNEFSVDGQRFRVNIPGRFNVWNALAAIGVARSLDIDDAASARGLQSLERVPGRMEHVRGGDIDVVVDYSHTPDSLALALSALRETTRGALAVVFGCGGDRDRGKRPEMGRVAAERADRTYVTNDNPRTEDPQTIANEILAGTGTARVVVELDRRKAIDRAIAEASPGDTVLIAGKGHENYQIIGDRTLPFDDAEVASEALIARDSRR
jgi:UDP-N-acetylmuramoyl-L-alanyl-D-glutamate--2,6-diaminopimelate ligase